MEFLLQYRLETFAETRTSSWQFEVFSGTRWHLDPLLGTLVAVSTVTTATHWGVKSRLA